MNSVSWSAVDERDVVAELLSPSFRVTFVEANRHDTYRLVGSLTQVKSWIREQRGDRDYILYVEIPREYEAAKFLVARLEGTISE